MHPIRNILKLRISRHLCSLFFLPGLLVLAAAGCGHTEAEKAAMTDIPEGSKPLSRRATAFETSGFEAPLSVLNTTNSADEEFKKLMEADDLAQGEVDGWIRENNEFAKQGAGISPPEMRQRVLKRLEPIGKAYAGFIQRHPDHVEARIAYASFLGDIGEEDAGVEQLEKARELNPKDPAIWNNLANYYGHDGPTTNAFIYYEKAIELDPNEPIYYQNFATTVYLFRHDATNLYNITIPQVFDKALDLYAKALKLDPTNFPLATDLASSYYGITPTRTNDALQAWTNALAVAHDDMEREGVYIHLARIKINAGRFDEARAHLAAVKEPIYDVLKQRVLRNLNEKEKLAKGTNDPSPAETDVPPAGSGADTNRP